MSDIRRKASKLLRGLAAVLKKPALLNHVLDHEDQHETQFKRDSGMQNGFPEVQLRHMMTGDVSVKPFAFLDGGSLPTDLALLKILAKRYQAKSYLEIGTWRGESVQNVAEIVESCFTLNLSDEELRSRGLSKEYIDLHRHFSKSNPRITHLFGDSRSFDFAPYFGKMDLVFVDGDHHYDSVVSDTITAFKLIREGGCIVWHDYAHSPEQVRWNVAHGIFQGTPQQHRKNLFAVSNTMCAMYSTEALPRNDRHYPANPGTGFELIIRP